MTAEAAVLQDITNWASPGSCRRLQMLRLDLIHPVVSGNKWFKLQPWLEAARDAGCTRVLSFGGGYSNHLVALASAASSAGLGSCGVVRGTYAALTPSLRACAGFGMELQFVSGAEYAVLKAGLDDHGAGTFVIPEGGAGEPGISGAARIATLIPEDATAVCVAAGTGTTMAGLDRRLPRATNIHAFGAAKDMSQAALLAAAARFPGRMRLEDVADRRFGRWTPELIRFMREFYTATQIPLDVVYTGKMMQRLEQLLHDGRFRGQSLVCVHTGGLQGNPEGMFS